MTHDTLNTTPFEPKIYVLCAEDKQAKDKNGAWINANQSVEEIHDDINQMLSKSPRSNAKKWVIQDYDDFGDIYLENNTTNPNVEEISKVASILSKYGDLGAQIIIHHNKYLDEALSALDEMYCGAYESETDYAIQLMNDFSSIPDNLLFYFDYDKFKRDLFAVDYYSIEIRGTCHVFHN